MADVADIVTALTEIDKRVAAAAKARTYYQGRQQDVYPAHIWEEAFGGYLKQPRDNMCPFVVQTITSRMKPKEFVAREDTPLDNEAADEVPSILRRNRFDILAPKIHKEVSKTSKVGIIVGVNGRGQAVLYPQDGDQIYVDYDPEYHGQTRWAAKMWIDGTVRKLTMYYPDIIERYELKVGEYDTIQTMADRARAFVRTNAKKNFMGQVPVFEGSYEESDLEPLYTLQPAADKAFADLLVISHTAGSPLRFVTGAGVGGDDEFPALGADVTPLGGGIDETHPIPPPVSADSREPVLETGPTRMLFLENELAKVGSLPAASLDGTLKLWDAIKYAVLRAKSIPPHLATMQGSGEPVTGRAMQVAEAQLGALVTEKTTIIGNFWEDVLAFAVQAERSHNSQGRFVSLAEQPAFELTWESPYTHEDMDQAERIGFLLDLAPTAYILETEFGLSAEDAQELATQVQGARAAQQSAALYGLGQGLPNEA